MDGLSEKIFQEQLVWVQCRLAALDKIESKLKAMRELAVYAASRTLSEQDTKIIQEWIDILQAEVETLNKSTAWVQNDPSGQN